MKATNDYRKADAVYEHSTTNKGALQRKMMVDRQQKILP